MTTALTATVQSQYGRVLLQLTWTTVTSATISRVNADGSIWPVRNAEPTGVASTTGVGAVAFDHEAPLDESVTYRATSTQSGTVVTSSAVTVPSDTGSLGSNMWLTHPLKPSLSQLLTVEGIAPAVRKGRAGILPVINRADPIAMTDVRQSPTGTITVATATVPEATALRALLADGQTLQVRAPGTWGVWMYVVIGDVDEVSAVGVGSNPERVWQLPYTAVGRPASTSQGAVGTTYADAKSSYATYALLKAGETTYNDLKIKAGP